MTTTCNTALVSECRSCMALILYGQSFESSTALLVEDYDNPLWKANKHKYFVGLVSIWTPMSSHSFQLKHVIIHLRGTIDTIRFTKLFPLLKMTALFQQNKFHKHAEKCDGQENCPFHLLKCQQQNNSHSFGKQTRNFLC